MRRSSGARGGWWLVSVCLFAGVAAPTVASAQTAAGGASSSAAPASGVDATAKARELFLKGKEFYGRGNKQAAYATYKEAWDVKQSYEIAGNLGNVAFELGEMRDAAEYLSYCRAHFPVTGSTEQLARIDQMLAEARKYVAAVRVEVRRGGSGGAEASADGAEVLVDGKSVGRAPLEGEVFLEPGGHTIKARFSGFRDEEKEIQGAKGSAQTVSLALDSVEHGVSGGVAEQGKAGAPRKVSLPIVVTGIGLATVGLGVGIGFTAAANGKSREAENIIASSLGGSRTACFGPTALPDCVKVKDAVKATDTFSNVAVAGFIAGGVAALGVGAYLFWPAQRPSIAVNVRAFPWVSAGIAGVGIVGAL